MTSSEADAQRVMASELAKIAYCPQTTSDLFVKGCTSPNVDSTIQRYFAPHSETKQ
jgi:hypothetical protein